MTTSKEKNFDAETLNIIERSDRLLDEGLIKSAIEELSIVISNNAPHPYLFAKLGYANMLDKKFKFAIDCFNKALEIKKNSPVTLFYRGQSKESVGDLSGALADYELSASIDGGDADVFCSIGMIYEFKRDYIKAESSYKSAISADPNNNVARSGLDNIGKASRDSG